MKCSRVIKKDEKCNGIMDKISTDKNGRTKWKCRKCGVAKMTRQVKLI